MELADRGGEEGCGEKGEADVCERKAEGDGDGDRRL